MRVLVRRPEEILEMFRRYGVRYVVLEEPSPKVQSLDPVFAELSRLVNSDGFAKLGVVPVETNRRNRAPRIEIYEVTDPRPAEADELTIELLTAGRTLRVPLERLGVPTRSRQKTGGGNPQVPRDSLQSKGATP